MVRIFIVIVFYLISLVSYSQTSNKVESISTPPVLQVTAQISNVSSDNGKVYFVLYNNEEGFNSKNYFKGEISDIFSDLKPDTYAIVCFHDANGNGKMDFESNGMPLEDYGISNNVISYGPPQFADAKFELKDKDLTFDIKL